MRKICFVTTISLTLKVFILDLAKYLHENGEYEITFICDEDAVFAKTLPDYIRFIPVPMKRGINLAGIKAVFQLFCIFRKNRFDIVQYSTPNASLYAALAAAVAGVKIRLYCQWGIVFVGFSGVKRKIFKLVERIICALSTWIEPDSYGNLHFSQGERLYTGKKSSVVWNGSSSGVNLRKFDISQKNSWRDETRNRLGICEDTVVMGFVGRITRDKGVNELFTAVKIILDDHENSVLMLVGDKEHTEELDSNLLNWANNERRVIHCGWTDQVERYFAAMDILLFPSYREGFGTVVIEAEAMGVPVIVSDIPGPTDAMMRDETGLVVMKGDAEALRKAIHAMIVNPGMLLLMSGKAIDFAQSRFDQARLFEKILEDRTRLLKQKGNCEKNC